MKRIGTESATKGGLRWRRLLMPLFFSVGVVTVSDGFAGDYSGHEGVQGVIAAAAEAGVDPTWSRDLIEAAERQHDREKQCDRDEDGQVLQRRQADNLENGVLGQFVLGDIAEDSGKLVRQQDGEEDEGDPQPRLGDFTKYVSVEYAKHG